MKPEGWGPWNVRAVNALVHLPSGLELRIGIRTPDGEEHWELRWRQVSRLVDYRNSTRTPPLGDDLSIMRSGCVEFSVAGFRWRMNFNGGSDACGCRIHPLSESCGGHSLLVRLDHVWQHDLPGSANSSGGALVTRRLSTVQGDEPDDLQEWVAAVKWAQDELHPGDPALELPCEYMAWIEVGASGMPRAHDACSRITPMTPVAKISIVDTPVELDRALWLGVAWNTIYQPRLKRLMTPVSRDWCVDEDNFGDYVLFPWDTFFCSLLASRRDQDLAYANVRAILAEMTDRGMLANVSGGAGKTLDRSQPPVGAYCVWKLHEKFNDLEFLAEVYPPLKRWHAFWMKYRDGNGDGLLEWGSDPIPAPVDWWKPHTQQAAKWESGLDNSPMYEDIPFNEEANTLELADIGLSCLYAADAEALANMAQALGLGDEAESFRAEYAQVAKRINEDLWDEEQGIYCNCHWDGRLSERWSPTSFYALYAGVATPERAERCVREHLMNPDEFWGEWVIPSISRKDPNFPVQKYWQGRVWPPMNFLCYEGLRRFGFHAEADELAAKSEALFLKEWREEGHIHENYNAITADGDDVNPDDPEGSSDPIYTWGGLLAYIALDARERARDSGSGIQPEQTDSPRVSF